MTPMEGLLSRQRHDSSHSEARLDAPDAVASREKLVAMLVIALSTMLVYSNTFDASFHFDDVDAIVNNPSLRDLSGVFPPVGNRWLAYLSFAINYRLGGLDVFGYHLVNLLIHACNGLLVFWLATITLRTPSIRRSEVVPLVRRHLPLVAGLLFAVHPVATQGVTYITQRFASLATMFFLLSLALYAQARVSLETEPRSKGRAYCLYCLAIVAAAAAMKTKEISVTLPLVAWGYEVLFFSRRKRLLMLAPLVATALLVPLGLSMQGGNLADVLGDPSRFAAETREIPRSVYVLTQSRVIVTYLRLLLLPVGQNLDYDFPLSHSLGEPGVLAALAILFAVASLAVFLLARARKTNRATGVLVSFGIAWFFVALSVESSIIPIRDVIFEHRMYLPSAGAVIALGTALLWAVDRLRLRLPLASQAAAALLVTAGPLGVATYTRNFVWKDELALWSDVVSKSPQKGRPHLNLGHAYQTRGQLDEAVREYQEALRLAPVSVEAHYNLGTIYQAWLQLDDAAAEYREAIRLLPGLPQAHDNLGIVYQAKGRLDDAAREYREAIRFDPGSVKAHYNLGTAYKAKGELDDAIREYREAIRLDPLEPDVHRKLGDAYQAKGQLDDAAHEYRDARRLNPGQP